MPLRVRRKANVNEIVIQLKHISFESGTFGAGEESICDLTLKLNSFWRTQVKSREILLNEQQNIVWGKATAALEDVIEINHINQGDEEKVFSKVVAVCILISGLGSPRSDAVIKETYPALHSVLKIGDMSRITDLPRTEKEQHLMEVVQIVMGIRLFNKDCRKGGEGIDDLPELLSRAFEATKKELECSLGHVRERCAIVTSTLCGLYRLGRDQQPEVKPTPNKQHVNLMKNALCLLWLQIFSLLELRAELAESEKHMKTCVEQLRETLVQLHETVRYRAAIPTVQVYPLFVQLSSVWRDLQFEAAVLSQLSQWLHTVTATVQTCDVRLRQLVPPSMSANPIPVPAASRTQLELRGFCPWTLVETEGVLMQGRHAEGGYCFQSQEAAVAWFEDAQRRERALNKVIASSPDLADFLQLHIKTPHQPEKQKASFTKTSEVEVQTDPQPMESFIDPNYEWSDWRLKQRALKMAKLTRCLTKSQQTQESGFRVSASTQCD